MEKITLTLDALGTILIAFAALRVHYRVLNEHKIDKKVFKAMKRERLIGITGVTLVLIGYLIQII
ncbi:hypothetical protein BMS3Abin15_00858 [bacterium BMS3Abin15]|nr:hypothetical protein BMS3Abin15_00858 [bacterium BMS3Abin15]HDH07766.1 hypothetical protein [Candidatus Moranbacteria bacterium]HDZ85131.1 hypothetical protein [Candidatus Moranbacteria bacterium]